MERTTAERIAKRFVSLPVEQRKQILDKMHASGQSFRLLPIVPTRQDVARIPLSYAQQRLLFLWQMEPEGTFYNVPTAVRLSGHLDDQAMSRALALLVQRHETLRTRFASVDGEFYQEIQEHSPVVLDIVSFEERPDEATLQAMVSEELARPFDLAEGPLLRVKLMHLGESEHLLTLCMHHIVSDGWSGELIVAEFVRLYTALIEDRDAGLPALPIQYADYAIWQRSWLEAGEGDRQLAYWRAQLGEDHPVLDLPLDHDRPASPSYRGAVVDADIPQTLAAELRALARKDGSTLFMLVLAAVSVVLSRYSGQADIRIGAPNASRNRTELEGLIGFFINTQVLRIQVDERATFAELIDQVRDVVAGAQSHQDLPFEQLVDALLPERNLGHNPLFQFKINQNVLSRADGSNRLGGVTVDAFALGDGDARFDLAFDFTDTPEGIEAAFTYATDLFDASIIERMASSLQSTLQALVRAPEARLLDHPENIGITVQTRAQSFACSSFLELWQRSLAQAGQRGALQADEKRISYQALEHESNRLAHYLQAAGVGVGSVVALCQARSIEWVTAMLAVLKAGGVYLPLDNQQPVERVQQLLHDSGAAVLLHEANDTRFTNLQGIKVQAWDTQVWAGQSYQSLDQSFDPEQPAYLIYTSGSTGQPKGVQVSHKALANYVQAVLDRLQLTPEGSMAMVSTVAADLGHTMLFGALASGRLLHLLPQELAFDPDAFATYMAEHQVAVLKLVPSHLQGLLQAASPADVLPGQLLILGGESCSWELVEKVRQLRPDCRIVNHYGPTETTVGVLTHEVGQRLNGYRSAPVGTPLANGRVDILDAWLNAVAPQVAGELYLGGQGLAQGYKGRAALTAERFIPAEDGQRLYRTGDRARLGRDGLIEFIGRADDQVKIRGYRVEPGEISQCLLRLEEVKEAVVLPLPVESDPSRLQLVAWCSVADGVSVVQLQQRLQAHLPDYMVPAQIVLLDRLPLTANGKLDKRALPKPGVVARGFVAPQGDVEQKLADIWAQVLKREQIGTTDNFFELGGDSILSLQIIARAKRQGIKLTPKQVFEQQTIGQLAKVARLIEAKPSAARPVSEVESRKPLVVLSPEQLGHLPVPAADIEDLYPLSPMQQGMLFHSLLDQEAGHYINQLRVDVQGLDVERFKAAWLSAISRHEVLRASFVEVDGQPLQIIRKQIDAPCVLLDWRNEVQQAQKLDDWALEDRRKGFDLACDPMLRLALIRTDDNTHHLIHTTHHILLDGWSNSQLMGEILQSYTGHAPAPITSRYRDYIEWLGKQDSVASEQFWKEQLAGLDEPTRLAQSIRQSDHSAEAGYGFHHFALDKQQTEQLSQFARSLRVTLNTLVQAAWIILLQRYTGQDTVACGVTVSGRPAELEGVEQQLGLFINTLTLVSRPLPEQSIGQWLQALQARNVVLREHEHTPLYDVQRWAGRSGEALFDTLLVFENYPISQALEKGVSHGLVFDGLTDHGQTNYALSLAAEMSDNLSFNFSYACAAFSDERIHQFAQGLERLLLLLSRDAQMPVGGLSIVSAQEHRQVVLELNRTHVDFTDADCLHRLIERQVARTPQATALVAGDQSLSYEQLNRHANRLAHKLCEYGVGPDVLVGIAMERSPEMVVGLLAILKAGGAYVPLDPDYPQERLKYMMRDSGIRLLLSQAHVLEQLPVSEHVPVVDVDLKAPGLTYYRTDNPVNTALPEHLAYMIYTSGSTGLPKGVEIRRGALLNHMLWMKSSIKLDDRDRVLQKTAFSFDASVWEFWLPLLTGAQLHLASAELMKDFSRLWDLVERQNITVLQLVPSLLSATLPFATQQSMASLRFLCCGGEALSTHIVDALYDKWQGTLINLYGPTEATIDACANVLSGADNAITPFIGKPLSNVKAYILSQDDVCPVGWTGELCIAGRSLARGYHDRPALTAERFIPDAFDTSEHGGGRLYRTGDLARHSADGMIDYAGRIDHQVKIRGFRIEPGEVESRLLEHEAIQQAIVVEVDGPRAKQLVAYVKPVDLSIVDHEMHQNTVSAAIRAHLEQILPHYMVPERYVFLATLPLTMSGKLDRRALPQQSFTQNGVKKALLRTRLERQLAAIWQEVLGVENIGLKDNFFELGGHSILLLGVLRKVRDQIDEKFSMHEFIQSPTIEGQADVLRGRMAGHASTVVKLNTHPDNKRGLFCLPPAGGTSFPYYPLAKALNSVCPVYALVHKGFVEKGFQYASWDAMVLYYLQEILQAQPEGPYNLLGWSSGGALAIEVAHRLEAAGKTVNLLALVESMMPQALSLKHRPVHELQDVDLASLDERNDAAMIMIRGFLPELDDAVILAHILKGRALGVQDDSLVAYMLKELNVHQDAQGLNSVYDIYATQAEFAVGFGIYENVATLARDFALRPLKVIPEVWWSSVSRRNIDGLEAEFIESCDLRTAPISERLNVSHERVVYAPEFLSTLRLRIARYL